MGGEGKPMTTKVLQPPLIKFFASSRRVGDTCRDVARQNKYLASCSLIEDLARLRAPQLGNVGGHSVVVLSHVDDDYLSLQKPEAEPVLEKAFHFLFTEATTHPDQVTLWKKGTKI